MLALLIVLGHLLAGLTIFFLVNSGIISRDYLARW